MLSRTLRRALLEQPSRIPPTFLLPWAAGLSTVSEVQNAPTPPPLKPQGANATNHAHTISHPVRSEPILSSKVSPIEVEGPSSAFDGATSTSPLELSPTVRELLPLLRMQSPHYITIHIHGKPYLLTQGDTVRLSFDMPDVEPGDTLRLTRAVNLGSREFTLKPPAAAPALRSSTHRSMLIKDPTSGTSGTESYVAQTEEQPSVAGKVSPAPHFIPHIAKGRTAYLDERLFVCRATVVGVESEPMRFIKKTKRRQRHVKTIKSKHRFTVLKIKELRIRSLEELENGELD